MFDNRLPKMCIHCKQKGFLEEIKTKDLSDISIKLTDKPEGSLTLCPNCKSEYLIMPEQNTFICTDCDHKWQIKFTAKNNKIYNKIV